MDETMTRLLAGEALTPMEAAVFGAEFVRAREFYRHHVADVLEVGERSLVDACEAVEALEVTLAEARASAPVAPVAEPATADEAMPEVVLTADRGTHSSKGQWRGVAWEWIVEFAADAVCAKNALIFIGCGRHAGADDSDLDAVVRLRVSRPIAVTQRVAEDLLHAALRRAVAARQSGTDNTKEPDHD